MKRIIISQSFRYVFLLLGLTFFIEDCHLGPDLPIYSYPPPVVNGFSPESGYPGSIVTITGKDFGNYPNAATVYFGGVPSDSIVSISDSQLVVIAPNAGVTGKITVKVWTHDDSTATAFTYLPLPQIKGINPTQGNVGDQLTITGQNFGGDSSNIQVWFADSVRAKLVSVTDTKIVVIVPAGGISGPITLRVGSLAIPGPVFSYPLVGLDFEFNNDGNSQGWIPQQNGTYSVSGGSLNVTFDPSQFSSSTRRSDIQLKDGTTIDASGYPIVAVKMRKPQICNVTFDTNLGAFGNGANQWTGVLNGNIYYYDMSKTPFTDNGVQTYVSTTQPTSFSTFQFKIADVASQETGYSVDWIKSFSSLSALEDSVALPPGELIYEFNNPGDNESWIPQQGGTWSVANGEMTVKFTQTSGKKRADLAETINGSGPTVTVNTGTYPIMAIKMTVPASADITFDTNKGSFGNGSNKYSKDFISDDVYYWDMSTLTLGSSGAQPNQQIGFTTFQFKIADVPQSDPSTGYSVDWLMTFPNVNALKSFINTEDSLLHK
jgi:hypothetical protein